MLSVYNNVDHLGHTYNYVGGGLRATGLLSWSNCLPERQLHPYLQNLFVVAHPLLNAIRTFIFG